MPDHDHSYKLLFSNAKLVVDLLRGYIAESWIDELDLSSLELVTSSFTSDDLRSREDDLIWRVRWGHEWLYLYLILEFQSTVDRWMAVRLMGYTALLWQDLIRSQRLGSNGLLPPVLPIVLYNGQPPWLSPTQLADLQAPGPSAVQPFRPTGSFWLIDEVRMNTSHQLGLRNLAAAIFSLEQRQDPAGVLRLTDHLRQWLADPSDAGLARAFTVWLSRVVSLYRPDTAKPLPAFSTLQEMHTMLATNIRDWFTEAEAKGEARGEAKGEAKGEMSMIRKLVAQRCITIDQARAQIHQMVEAGTITQADATAVLSQMG